jgi:spermidine synthase
MVRPPARCTAPEGRDLVLLGCFFASGFLGLVYEIAWIREASLAFGSATLALGTVVAVFLRGAGGQLFGRRSVRSARPLALYARLELGLGVLAMASPFAFAAGDALYGLFYPAVQDAPAAHTALVTSLRGP